VIPLQRFPEIRDREDGEYAQRDDFLDRLQLRCRILIRPQAIGGNLKAILHRSDQPTNDNGLPQWRFAKLQVPVPREGHKDI